jgi:hypothetical protein
MIRSCSVLSKLIYFLRKVKQLCCFYLEVYPVVKSNLSEDGISEVGGCLDVHWLGDFLEGCPAPGLQGILPLVGALESLAIRRFGVLADSWTWVFVI